MPKVRTTLTLDEDILRAVERRAAESGRETSAVIEEALMRDLGHELLNSLWASSTLDADEAMELALEAQDQTRRARG